MATAGPRDSSTHRSKVRAAPHETLHLQPSESPVRASVASRRPCRRASASGDLARRGPPRARGLRALATIFARPATPSDTTYSCAQATDKAKKQPDQTKARKGGKASLGRPEDDLLLEVTQKGDPNYEEEILASPQDAAHGWVIPTPTKDEFKPIIVSALDEFLTNGDVDDFIVSLQECGADQAAAGSGLAQELVKRALLLALDRKTRDREQVSQLLAALRTRRVLESAQAAAGFGLLLSDDDYLSDLVLDAPDALTALAQFIARAIVDEVLAPSFLNAQDFVPGPRHGAKVLSNAAVIQRAHTMSAVGRIWGPGDGRPVAERKREISLLLGEYLIGGDLAEATRCTRELESPYYLHELVKQAIVTSIDKTATEHKLVVQLFEHLCAEQLLRGNQLAQGFERTLERMDDLSLDAPNALAVFQEAFVTPATAVGWVPESFAARCVPMSEVKERIDCMIQELFDNGEPGVAEATRCLIEIGMDHLHGQVVKRLCAKAMDKTDREQQLASLLIFNWRQSDKISPSAVHAGFTALLSSLGDISLDVPDAGVYMEGFVGRAQHDGLIPDNFLEEQRTAAAGSPRR